LYSATLHYSTNRKSSQLTDSEFIIQMLKFSVKNYTVNTDQNLILFDKSQMVEYACVCIEPGRSAGSLPERSSN